MSEELKAIEAKRYCYSTAYDGHNQLYCGSEAVREPGPFVHESDYDDCLRLLREARARVEYLEADIGPQVAEYLAGDARLIHKNIALEAENERLRGALDGLFAQVMQGLEAYDVNASPSMQTALKEAALSLKQGKSS